MNPLEKIIKYKMTSEEAEAYRLALLWERLIKKFLPEEQYKMTGSRQDYSGGDPRNAYLFKLCWKLRRETRGLIKEEDYKYYLYAQIDTLKKISSNQKHAYIDNSVIVGNKAWRRWRFWQYRFNKRISCNRELAPISEQQTIEELARVKRFLLKTCGKTPSIEDYSVDLINKWLGDGDITPTYILLSPFIRHLIGDSFCHLGFDPKLYDSRLTGIVHDYFQKEFDHEFAKSN